MLIDIYCPVCKTTAIVSTNYADDTYDRHNRMHDIDVKFKLSNVQKLRRLINAHDYSMVCMEIDS